MLLCLFFLLVLSPAYSLRLGTLSKADFAVVEQGKTAEFTVLFWSLDNESYPVSLSAEDVPEKMEVIISPKNFMLGQSERAEMLNVPQGNRLVRADAVKIYVSVPDGYEVGKYSFSVKAVAGERGEQISVLQTRTFRFTLDVEEASEKSVVGRIVSAATGFVSRIFGSIGNISGGENTFRTLALIFATILILFLAWRFYKYE